MTNKDAGILFHQLEKVFDIVRLVDTITNCHYTINEENQIVESSYLCFHIWKKERRCENCISAKAFICKEKTTKFEFVDDEVYHIISKYIEIEKKPYVLEMVTVISDDVLFGAYRKKEFVKSISKYNEKLYVDFLTNAYNRRYYDEFLNGLDNISAVAMFDVDDFKNINDTFGHMNGDIVLKDIVKAVYLCITDNDVIIRYGGDEFLIVFYSISKSEFQIRLEEIRKKVNQIELIECQGTKLSVSIGGIYAPKDSKNFIHDVDKMLYKAKEYKNHVQL